MIFAGLGIWLIIKKSKNHFSIADDMISFSLIIGLLGVYVSSAFVRLEVFASISIIILSSLGLSLLLKELNFNKFEVKKSKNLLIKMPIFFGLILLLIIPLTFPVQGNTLSLTNTPPTILNGGSTYKITTSDWTDSLEWIKNNTPKDAVIGAWWDYGYWIQTKGDRATLADNSTVNDHIIKKIAKIFSSSPEQGWQTLREMESDYFVIFIVGERVDVDHGAQPLYLLNGGGDESKKQWFMRIANEPLPKFLHSDGTSGTDFFWNETLLGKMIPFSPLTYVNLQNNQQSSTFQPGFIPVYVKDIKYPIDENNPLKLVYASPSFDVKRGGQMLGVFVYEVNKDYVPVN